ncbi:MAG: UDP-N-acetylmuramate dehydrogenase [Prevotellaceae bacterium]|jgi:UDP-N-acetylmuramate dehydrogenase|nr:UDP-N-acetylmuramate dehydrogenase [Prevotellaceae bacterium]
MEVHSHYSLKHFNTFGFDVHAGLFAAASTTDELLSLLSDKRYRALPLLILGGGSNMVFCDDFNGLVIHPQMTGIEKQAEDAEFVYLRVGAGVVWDDFVSYAVQRNWGGAENLSLIPGRVGAAPVQNIGAYGVEAKAIIHQIECILIDTGERRLFSNAECAFGYRDSAFKHAWKNKTIITHVVFRLRKKPVLQTHYGHIAAELKNYPDISLQTIRQAIITIRRTKLPDPAETGNAGSFFKNPVVPNETAARIAAIDPRLTTYPVDDTSVKLPAGRLIELAGWKGRRIGNVGVHTQQALILVHYGGATGHDIMALAAAIQQSVYNKFGVHLEREVNVIVNPPNN